MSTGTNKENGFFSLARELLRLGPSRKANGFSLFRLMMEDSEMMQAISQDPIAQGLLEEVENWQQFELDR